MILECPKAINNLLTATSSEQPNTQQSACVCGAWHQSSAAGGTYSTFCMAKRDASSVPALVDFLRSECILPTAEKTRSTPADDAGPVRAPPFLHQVSSH